MAQIIDSWLTSEYDKTGQRLTVRFDTSAVEALRPTIMEQSSLWQMMLSMGIVTTNEARAHFGVGAPVEWGNVPVRSGGLAPIGTDGMPVMPAAPAAPGAPAPEGPKPAEGKEPAVIDAMTPEDESDDPEVQPVTPTVSSWQGFGGSSQSGLPKGKKHADHDQSDHGNRDGAGGGGDPATPGERSEASAARRPTTRRGITPEALSAVEKYAHGKTENDKWTAREWNEGLRSGKIKLGSDKEIDALAKLANENVIVEETTFYRGSFALVDPDQIEEIYDDPSTLRIPGVSNNGQTTQAGFTSLSEAEWMAREFARGKFDDQQEIEDSGKALVGILWQVTAPAGARGVSLKELSGSFGLESETILPPGTQIDWNDVEFEGDETGGTVIVYGEIVVNDPVKSLKHGDHDQTDHGNRDGAGGGGEDKPSGGYVRDEKKEEQASWYLKRDVTDEDRKAAELSGQDIDEWALNKSFDESAEKLRKEREAEKQSKEQERVSLRETRPRIAFDKSTPVPGGVATIPVTRAQAEALATTLWGQGEGSTSGYTEELERSTREAVEAAINNPRGGLVLPSYGAAQAIANALTSVGQARSDDGGGGAARRYVNLAEKIVGAMKDDPFAAVSGSHSTTWVFDPFDQPSGEGFSLSQLDTPAKFLAIKHGDHDQGDHGNRDGAGGGSDSSSPTAGSRGGSMGYRATAAIESAGGRVKSMDFDSDNAAIEKFQEQVEEAYVAMLPDMDDPDNIPEDHDPRIASGIEHMGQALMDQGTPGAKVTIIQDKDGNIAGAGSSTLMQHPDGYEAVLLTVFGTNGLVPGAGSAIISRLIGEAFENDQGFVITAAEPEAWEFYERVGLGAPQKNEGGGSATFLLTPDQVGEWIASYVAEEEGM